MTAEIPDRAVRWLAGLCVVLLVAEFLIDRHPYVPGEGLPWFYCLVGFVAFTLIVLGAKFLRRGIRRPEGFYGGAAIDAEAYPPSGLDMREAGEGGSGADGDCEERDCENDNVDRDGAAARVSKRA